MYFNVYNIFLDQLIGQKTDKNYDPNVLEDTVYSMSEQKSNINILSTPNISDNKVRVSYTKPNIVLLIFDIVILPIQIIRMILIYMWGSKYNIPGFQFLDVIMHADSPYFNQEDCSAIDTLKGDYRIVIREDSRLFSTDFKNLISSFKKIETNKGIHSKQKSSRTKSTINIKNTDRSKRPNNKKSDNIEVVVGYTVGKAKTEWDIVSENADDCSEDDIECASRADISDDESNYTDDNELNEDNTKQQTKLKQITKNAFFLSDAPNIKRNTTNSVRAGVVKGVDYFECNDDEKYKKKKTNISSNVLDSIKQDLDSAFEV